MAVYFIVADLIHHAVVHVLENRGQPADIQLTLLTCVAYRHVSWRVQKNCGANRQEADGVIL